MPMGPAVTLVCAGVMFMNCCGESVQGSGSGELVTWRLDFSD